MAALARLDDVYVKVASVFDHRPAAKLSPLSRNDLSLETTSLFLSFSVSVSILFVDSYVSHQIAVDV